MPGQPVTFDSSCSSDRDADGRIVARGWDTDADGAWDNVGAVTVTRTFDTPGTYTLLLGVRDDEDDWDVETKTVTVNAPPSASFTNSPAMPRAGDAVTFSSTSSDSDGTIARYEWALDADGVFDDGTGSNVSRAFPAGTHTVRLRVTDDRGAQAVATRRRDIAEPPASAPPAEDEACDPTTPVGSEPSAAPAPAAVSPPPPRWLEPFPTVRIRGRTTTTGVRLSLLAVRAPAGSVVKLRCSGRSCPAKSVLARVRSRRATGNVRFRRLERRLRAGTVVRVFVTRRGVIGKYTRFRIRRLALPVRTDRCLVPGSSKPVRCPGAP